MHLRSAEAGDAERFGEIIGHPDVARWWADVDWTPDDSVQELLNPVDGTETFAIVVDDEVVGVIQSYDEAEPQYHHAGMDIAIHPDRHGQGIGTDALRTLARHLFHERGPPPPRHRPRRRQRGGDQHLPQGRVPPGGGHAVLRARRRRHLARRPPHGPAAS